MVGNLIANVTTRRRTEPGDLHATTRMARRLADAPDLPMSQRSRIGDRVDLGEQAGAIRLISPRRGQGRR